MDFNITVTNYDLANKTMCWYIKEMPVISRAMKEAMGLQFDGSRLKYEDYGDLFSIMFSQQQGTKGSLNYATYSKLPGFKTLGKSKWSNAQMFNVFTLSMWNGSGGTSLLSKTFVCDMMEPIPEDVRKAMAQAAKEYAKGIVHCSHCEKEIQKSDIAGRYFAGVYCTDCWERTYKAIEARETYN
ncbi:MAG: hypothetical protein ACXAEN_14340 [Candidatus Thorarchaeota archaeon]|jgi:hypothetical protein